MKKTLIAALFALTAAPALADPADGMWKTEMDDGAYAHVKIQDCSGKVCGYIMRTFNADGEYKSPNIGKALIRHMVPQGGGKYEGQVWRPSDDKIFNGKLQLSGNSLSMSGCVMGGLICSSQTWTRIQ